IGYTLIDDNEGGGVVVTNIGGSAPSLSLVSSTVTGTAGAGVALNGADDVTLYQATIACNNGVGLQIQSGASATTYGSIIANNGGGNCSAAVDDQGYNVENQNSCGLGPNSLKSTD